MWLFWGDENVAKLIVVQFYISDLLKALNFTLKWMNCVICELHFNNAAAAATPQKKRKREKQTKCN